MMLFNNRNTLIYKVIWGLICAIIDEHICLEYLGLLLETLSKHNDNFKNSKFNNLSRLGITDILINIISCHGFDKSSISTAILTCRNSLVPYYISKLFFAVEIELGGVDSIYETVKKQINSTHLYEEEILLICKVAIPSIFNTLKNHHCNRFV